MHNATAKPNYRHGIMDNYGKEIYSGTLQIKGELSHNEHGESVFKNLEMSGGDLKANGGSVNISGKLSGTIKDISAGCQGSLYINEYDATRTGYCCAAGGGIYTSDENYKKITQEVTDLSQEEALLKKFEKATRVTPEQAYERYQLIKQGKENQLYLAYTVGQIKRAHPNDWKAIMAMNEWGLPGGGHSFERHVIRPVLKGGPIAAVGAIVPPLAPVAYGLAAGVAVHTATGGRAPVSFGVDHRGNMAAGYGTESVDYQLTNQRRAQDRQTNQIRDTFGNTPYMPLPRNKNHPYWKEMEETLPQKIKLAKELQTLFKPVNTYNSWNHKSYIYGTCKCLDNPLNIIKNAYSMKVDTSRYWSNRTYYSRLYQSLKNAQIPHQDILSIWGNPYINAATNWNIMLYQKQQSIRNQYPGIDDVAKGISSIKYDFANVLSKTTPEVRQFVNDFAIPITTISSMYKGTPTNLKQVANKLGAFLCDVAYEFDKAFIPGFAAYASGGSIGDIVTSAGSDLVMMYCGGKFLQVGWKGVQRATYAGAQMLSKTTNVSRPTWRETEQYLCKLFGKKSKSQISYLYGKEVKYGTAGSVRPDFIHKGKAVEAKNYDIAKNSLGLISKIAEQVNKRAIHLPKGTPQGVYIDIRGQKVTKATMKKIEQKIVEKCNGILTKRDIEFIEK